jgi:hypothetical protein
MPDDLPTPRSIARTGPAIATRGDGSPKRISAARGDRVHSRSHDEKTNSSDDANPR